jgi:hypothetical protein
MGWSTVDSPRTTAHFPKFQNLFPLFLIIKFIITGINRGGNGVIPPLKGARGILQTINLYQWSTCNFFWMSQIFDTQRDV